MSPKTQTRATSPLMSLTSEALKSCASVSSKAEKLLYSEVVSGEVCHTPRQNPDGVSCLSERPAEAVPVEKPALAETLAEMPEVNTNTCGKDSWAHSLDMCASREGRPVEYVNKYNTYCATDESTSTSNNDDGTWITVERKKNRCARKDKMPALRNDVHKKFGTRTNDKVSHETVDMPKGKGPDPENWGNVRLTREEMDPDSQRVLLDSYKSAQKNKNKKRLNKRKHSAIKHEHPVEVLYSTDKSELNREKFGGRAMCPIEQVEPSSYIGLALKHLKGGRKPTEEKSNSSSESDKPSECSDPGGYELSDETESSDESSISESSTSSSSESSDESSISTLSTISSSCKRKGRKRSNKGERSSGKKRRAKQKSSKRKKHQKMKLKPIPPNEYDGAVDPQMFHRFITE